MDHEPGAERLRRQYLECGEVAIDVRDVDGLLDTALDMNFDMSVVNTRFSADQLAAITGSEFRLVPDTVAGPRGIEATISYLIDTYSSNPEQDLYDIYDHLVTRLDYDQTKFAWLPRQDDSHILAYELDDGLVATITIDDVVNISDFREVSPGVITQRVQLEGVRSNSQLREGILAAMRLWGNLHDAVSYPRSGRHTARPDSPHVITIREFQPTDDTLVLLNILMRYEAASISSDETLPSVDMDSIDLHFLAEALNGADEERLVKALALLEHELREEYGRVGEMPQITGERLLRAVSRIEPEA